MVTEHEEWRRGQQEKTSRTKRRTETGDEGGEKEKGADEERDRGGESRSGTNG